MAQTLHIALKPLDAASVELRYYLANPNDYQRRTLPLAEIQTLLDRAETDYYTLLPAELARTGRQLYAWLDSADRFLAQAIEAARGQTEVLVLAVAAGGPLAHLPWETLHDGVAFLVQRQNPLLVPARWREGPAPALPPENRALRVLFMATSPLGVEPVLDFEHEEGLILEATRKQPLELLVEESGDLAELKNLIDSYEAGYFDVVHLTGHASLTEEGPVFLTETETGAAHYASAAELGRALSRRPRLIFLSGCRTGEALRAGEVPSLAETLLAQGARAVLGWGRPVLDPEASAAAACLYAGLATGAEPARALAETYQTLLDKQARDWHLLRLYLAGDPPGPLVTPLRHPGRRPAPPPSSETKFLDPRRQQVKVPTRQAFVGRRRALQRCLQALRYAPDKIGVLLHGMGGLGKSSLAARLADRLPDYQTLVWVGPLDEFALVNRLVEEAPLNQAQRDSLLNPQEALRFKLRAVLAQVDQPLLLVLDDFEANFEHDDGRLRLRAGLPLLSIEAQTVLAALAFALHLETSRHRLIITSRYQLDTAAAAALVTEPLDPLRGADLDKKVRRLARAQARGAPAKDLAAQAIAVADGNPRLLEWLFELLGQAGLDHPLILARMAARALEFRESILAEELLRQQEAGLRQLLAAALVYHLPVPPEALAALSDPIPAWETHLGRAAALGLIEVTRQPPQADLYYAPRLLAELLTAEAPPDPTALARRAAETLYRLWWQEAASSSEEHLLEIHRLAVAGQAAEIAAEIAVVLTNRWNNRSRYREAAGLCRETLALAPDYRVLHRLAIAEATLGQVEAAAQHYQQAMQGCPPEAEGEQASIMANLAGMYRTQGQPQKALEMYQRSTAILESIGDVRGKAATLHQMAGIYATQGQIEEALRLYRQSLEMKESIGDVRGQAATLHEIARIYATQGQIEEALRLYRQSLEMKESIGDVQGQAATLHQMAGIYADQGQIEEALRLFRQSLEITESIGDVKVKAATLHQMAGIYASQGQIEEALRLYRQSIEIEESIGNVQGQAATLHQMAGIYVTQGQIEEALRLYRQSLEITESIGNVQGQAATLHQMAGIYASQGQIEEALRLYRQSLEMKESIGDVQGKASTLRWIATIYTDQGKIDEALVLFQQTLEIAESIGDVSGKASSLHQMAGIYATQGQIEEALRLYRQSLEITENIGNVQVKAHTLAMMAQLLAYRQGDFETALAYLQESAGILERLKSPDAQTVQEIMFEVWLAQARQRLGEETFQQLQAALAAGDEAGVKALLGGA